MTMDSPNPKVDAYLDRAGQWRDELTRLAHIGKCAPLILAGKGLND